MSTRWSDIAQKYWGRKWDGRDFPKICHHWGHHCIFSWSMVKSVLFFYVYYFKLSQTWWLKTKEICIVFLEGENWNQSRQDSAPSESPERESISCFFQPLVTDGIPWLIATLLQKSSLFKSLFALSSYFNCLCISSDLPWFPFIMTLMIALRVYMDNTGWTPHLKMLNLVTSAMIPFFCLFVCHFKVINIVFRD